MHQRGALLTSSDLYLIAEGFIKMYVREKFS